MLNNLIKKNLMLSTHDSGLELHVFEVENDPDRIILHQTVTKDWLEEVIIRKDTLQEICKRLNETETENKTRC